MFIIGEKVDFIIQVDPGLGLVRADPTQIQQVLLNLVVNARDAMPKGGTLRIESANVEIEKDSAQAGQPHVPGSYVMISVSDTGTGMDEQIVSRVFEPFFTTKDVGKGTGFGLSISFEIIRQSGGYICIESEPGGGSTFKVYLPRISGELANTLPPAPSKAKVKEARTTILVVEDEPRMAEMIRTLLKESGYAVLDASSAEGALTIARSYKEKINLMLADVILGGVLDGPELARQIGAIKPGIKVLYMSGYAHARDKIGSDKGIVLIEKPFASADILQRLKETLYQTNEDAFQQVV